MGYHSSYPDKIMTKKKQITQFNTLKNSQNLGENWVERYGERSFN